MGCARWFNGFVLGAQYADSLRGVTIFNPAREKLCLPRLRQEAVEERDETNRFS